MRRREFLVGSAAGAAGLLVPGCGEDQAVDGGAVMPDSGTPDAGFDAGRTDSGAIDAGAIDAGEVDAAPPGCEPPDDSELLSVVRLLGVSRDLDVVLGEGEQRRLYRDLSLVDAESLVTAKDLFYIRTGFAPEIDAAAWEASWNLSVHGLVGAPQNLSIAELQKEEVDLGQVTLECSGNYLDAGFGMLSNAEWSGVPIETVLGWADPDAGTRVHFKGINRYFPLDPLQNTDWIYSRDDLVSAGAFLALGMNGRPLPIDHGRPCRLIVPRWYGCCCTKWLREIELVADDVPATPHMLEYRSRTHQPADVTLAREFIPSVMDVAAVASRVEKRRRGGAIFYRVHGILWGGTAPAERLVVTGDDFYSVFDATICPAQTDNDVWTVWWADWNPPGKGAYSLRCRVEAPALRQRRLDTGFYRRSVVIDEL